MPAAQLFEHVAAAVAPEAVEKAPHYSGSAEQDMERLVDEAPDDFLDPILNSIMTDPVYLPTSTKVINPVYPPTRLLAHQPAHLHQGDQPRPPACPP